MPQHAASLNISSTSQPTLAGQSNDHSMNGFVWNSSDLNCVPYLPANLDPALEANSHNLRTGEIPMSYPNHVPVQTQAPQLHTNYDAMHGQHVTALPSNHLPTDIPTIDDSTWKHRRFTTDTNSHRLGSTAGMQPTPESPGSISEPPPSTVTDDLEEIPALDATVEEKFDFLLACTRRVGYDSFDTLVSQYYSKSFDHASALALDQRLSRNRRLPAILAELRDRSETWTPWERRGYQDEILKSAEKICISEYHDLLRQGENTSRVGSANHFHPSLPMSEKALQDKVRPYFQKLYQ